MMRYTIETRLTGNFDTLSDAKKWAAEQRDLDMEVTKPQKLVTNKWLCIAVEVATIESFKL